MTTLTVTGSGTSLFSQLASTFDTDHLAAATFFGNTFGQANDDFGAGNYTLISRTSSTFSANMLGAGGVLNLKGSGFLGTGGSISHLDFTVSSSLHWSVDGSASWTYAGGIPNGVMTSIDTVSGSTHIHILGSLQELSHNLVGTVTLIDIYNGSMLEEVKGSFDFQTGAGTISSISYSDGAGNSATLSGGINGVDFVAALQDAVTNSDTISSALTAANLLNNIGAVSSSSSFTLSAGSTSLTLLGTANIDGTGNDGNNTLTGNAGSNSLDGGIGNDTMIGGLGNDTFFVDSPSDVISDAGGTDTVVSTITWTLGSGLENLILAPGSGNINGTGNSSVNVITGNEGDNVLDGKSGADTMIGGDGDDTYFVDNTLDKVIESPNQGTDIVYSSATFTLSPDVENLVLTGTSAINGTGNASANTISGNAGANLLNGGGGTDTMIGGAGSDTYVVDSLDDVVLETTAGSAGGTDTVRSTISYTLGSNLENLDLRLGGSIDGIGNELANTITGSALNNTLDGKGGFDKLLGGTGDDTYIVDLIALNGVAKLEDAVTEAAGTDTLMLRASNLGLATPTMMVLASGLENFDISLTGSNKLNMTGNAVANTLTGNAYDNYINGAAGADVMYGGLGNDTYVFDTAADSAHENASAGSDTVVIAYANASAITPITIDLHNVAYANIENLTVTGSGLFNLTGDSNDNTFIGNSSVNVMAGGDGNDTYFVSAGDTVTENSNEGSADLVMSAISWTLGLNIENLTLTGTSSGAGTGNALNNVITGNSAANGLTGNGGDDYLIGNAGADILNGGAGNDTLDGGTGLDQLIGGAGMDRFVFHTTPAGTSITVDVILDFTKGPGGDALNIYDMLAGYSGGSVADYVHLTVSGSSTTILVDANGLTGGASFIPIATLSGVTGLDADTMVANLNLIVTAPLFSSGNDSVDFNALSAGVHDILGFHDALGGNDTVLLPSAATAATIGYDSTVAFTGNDGNDAITGNDMNDTISGGAGNDVIIGGAGDDVLAGSGGTDTVSYAGASSGVTVDLSNSSAQNTGGAGTDTLSGFENLTGSSNVDILTGDGGNNTLDGGAGADTMDGGLGNDFFVVDNASDKITDAGGTDTALVGITYDASSLAASVDNFTLTGSGNYGVTGNSLANVITGNSGDNTLQGNGGNDTLDGGAGNDWLYCASGNGTLIGGLGDDQLNGGVGTMTMIGGDGNDTYATSSGSDVIIEAANGGTDIVFTGVNNYVLPDNVENMTLNALNLSVTGNDGDNLITALWGNETLNGGLGVDTLVGGDGNDTYIINSNDGDVITETVTGGTDTVQASVTISVLADNVEKLTLTGSGNIDGAGNSGDNVITGNSGNNTLDGGAGADTMDGGLGNDVFIVDNVSDKVTDTSGTDTVMAGLSYNGSSLAASVDNFTLTGSGNFSLTGNSLDNIITGNGGDNSLIGNGGNDTLDGGAGNDWLYCASGNGTLIGGLGNDTLLGGIGAMTMTGGDGNDTYGTSSGSDVIIEAANGGTDIVFTGVNNYVLPDNVENMSLNGLNMSVTGNDLDNVITGLWGNDTLNGGVGADSLIGGGGNDTYIIDNAGDSVVAGGGTDTIISSVTYSIASNANVENLTLSGSANIDGTGNSGDNVVTGNSGDNSLIGGSGNDTIEGGLGSNVLDGGLGTDTLTYEHAAAGVTVSLAVSTAQSTGGAGTDTLSNFENLTGSAFNDVLTGDSNNNVIEGGAGNDILNGGAGTDTLSYVHATAGVTVDLSASTSTGGAGTDTVTNFENLTGSSYNDVLTGSSGVNTIDGGAGDDTLYGGGGLDTIYGGDGNDTLYGINAGAGNTLYGGNGDDTLIQNSGNNYLAGGVGNDTYVMDNGGGSLVENVGEGTDTIVSASTWTLSSTYELENLTLSGSAAIDGTGNSLDNVIIGNSGVNTLSGMAGHDSLTGGSGADTFVFHAAQASSAANADTITDFTAGSGNDKLDIHDILVGYGGGTVADFVQLSETGGNTVVSVDADGTANGVSFIQIATLTGVTGLSADQMVTDGNLIVT